MKKQIIFTLLISIVMATTGNAQTSALPVDYINVPGPVVFDNQSFNLNWSSHPGDNYYKQEYILKGDNADKFKMMLLNEIVTGTANVKEVVDAKVAELKKMKETNPVVNYEIVQNSKSGEYMIDFLLSANAADGTMAIVERNVYRYKVFTDKSGHKGVQLFGVSCRSYGANIDRFLVALKSNRRDLMTKVSAFSVPQVRL